MKTIKRILMLAILMVAVSSVFAQEDWKLAPSANEKTVDGVIREIDGGHVWRKKSGKIINSSFWQRFDRRIQYTDEQLYTKLLSYVKNLYPNYPELSLRNFKSDYQERLLFNDAGYHKYNCKYIVSATVVIPNPAKKAEENLTNAICKAIQNVRIGSRIAIDRIRVINGINEEDCKDRVIEILLEKGYKVVAKDFLERLYNEQKQQQSEVYNKQTTVQGNNFSAVGYYLNVTMSEKSLKVQAINVSTGEYEGNATVNF